VGSPREDVEDELGAVDDAQLGKVADGLDLGRRKVLVENDQVRSELLERMMRSLSFPTPIR